MLQTKTKCLCGCGELADRLYKLGHNGRSTPYDYIEEDKGYKTKCWIWQRAQGTTGYGIVTIDRKSKKAHRHYYEKYNGEIPNNLPLDHLCRQPLCVNPKHLEAVEIRINTQRGRHAKLNPDSVRYIRSSNKTSKELAKELGVSYITVQECNRRKTWKNIL